MEKELFDDLMASIREAQAIARQQAPAARRKTVSPLDVKAVRERLGLSQNDFARLLHVSVKTLQNWEQQRRQPTGPAAALLQIAQAAPDVVLRTLHA